MTYSKIDIKQEPDKGVLKDNQGKAKVGELAESDVDLYEETDECDLENSEQMIWLVKLPQFVQDRWDDIPSDSEEVIELGTVLINKRDPNVMAKIILSDDQNINEGLPREYDLKNCAKPRISNTFVFTEKVSKKANKRKLRNAKEGFPEIPRRLLWKNDTQRAEKKFKPSKSNDEGKEKEDIFFKAPHNPTAVIGAVAAELQMKPASSVEHSEFERRLQMTANIKKPVKLLNKVPMNNTLNPGTTGVVMKQFLKIAPSDKNRVKTLDKAYRISKEELQTKIFALFEKYEYYTMKDLVEKLRQPQIYLQEVLEDIGNYNTHGDFFGKWCLRSEYKQAIEKKNTYQTIDK